LVLKGFIK